MDSLYEMLDMAHVPRLCFIGPTGVGKSTAASAVCKMVAGAQLIKVAAPLYDMQEAIYRRLGAMAAKQQDGELLQFLGHKIERDHPGFLAGDFVARLDSLVGTRPTMILNDDARPPNTDVLRDQGFLLVRVVGPIRVRQDLTPIDPSHPSERGIAAVRSDLELINTGSERSLRAAIAEMLGTPSAPHAGSAVVGETRFSS